MSLVISIFAITISTYNLYEARKTNRLSQVPIIVGHSISNPTDYSYFIKNKGNGPALFEKAECFENLCPLEIKSLRESVRTFLDRKSIHYQLIMTDLGDNSVLAAGEELCIAKITVGKEDASKLKDIEDGVFAVKISYKSCYGISSVWATDDSLIDK